MTNILLVEDEPLIAEEIRQTLRPAGYEVINGYSDSAADEKSFASGVNALIDHSQVAVVLMDINLAGKFDGVEIGKRLHERSNVPVIFITGYSDAETLSRAIGTGPSGYLIKPISGRQLLAQIELTLQRNGLDKKREENMEAQAGLWNLTLCGDKIDSTFGWLSQFRYLRHDIASFQDFRRIVNASDAIALEEFIKNCRVADKTGAQIEYRLFNAEGYERWALTKILKIETDEASVRISAINFDITEQKQKELRLQHRATHDPLTNLYNRAYFMSELQRHAARQTKPESYAILFADLDKFKPVNDEFGHGAGDRLLVEVARRFARAVKKTDIVARFGGDEFVFLIRQLKQTKDLEKLARRILLSLADPVRIDDKMVKIGCSIGGATNLPYDKNADLVLRDADIALYSAKKSHTDKYSLYEENDKSKVLAQLMTSEALRNAVKQEQITPYFRPIFLWADQPRLAGLKIEMNWNHPFQGPIPFAAYREVAEDSGLIVPVTLKVLENTMAHIRGSSAAKRNLLVLFHLNRRLLSLKDWPVIVTMASEQHTEAGTQLVVELDEAAFYRPVNLDAIRSLRKAGIRFCLNVNSAPQNGHEVAKMPFDFFCFADGSAENFQRSRDFCSILSASGKTALVSGMHPGNRDNLRKLCRYYIAGRIFPLIAAKRKKSDRAVEKK